MLQGSETIRLLLVDNVYQRDVEIALRMTKPIVFVS